MKDNYTVDSLVLNDEILVLRISGDLNIANAKKLIEVIQANINEYDKIVIDLSETLYLNSSAIGALISFRQHPMKEIKFIIPEKSHIAVICKTLNLHRFFSIFESLEQIINE